MALRTTNFLRLLVLTQCVFCLKVNARVTLQIGGLFGIDTSQGGWNSGGIVPAVQMAFEDINNTTDILKDYTLELEIKDSKPMKFVKISGIPRASDKPNDERALGSCFYVTKCNIGEAVRGAMEYISTGQTKIMFLGPGCSKAAMPVAESVHYWNIVQKKDARIIFGFFYPGEHYTVFCETYRQGMYGDKYVWILISGRNDDNWWKVQSPLVACTPKEIREGLGNNLGTGEMKLSTNPQKTISGQGQIRFNKNFDRITKLEIRQVQAAPADKPQSEFDNIFAGDTEKRVGLYDMDTDTYIDDPYNTYSWQGGRVPVDGLTTTTKELSVSPWLFWTTTVLSLIGILLSCGFLIFNIYKRDVRYIKMSSPNLNNLLIVGCILVYIGGIVSGYSGDHLHVFCKVIIRDRQLFGMVGVLLVIDLVILITWQLVDPLVVLKFSMPKQISGDTAVLPYIRLCGNSHLEIWKSVMFGYK
ncbi:hypothetical protein QZH41_019563, partial [Actinostola sp. cb2023]